MPKLRYMQTYLPYPDGIDPELLRVGTLAMDIVNPFQSRESNEFRFRQDLNQEQYSDLIKTLPGYSNQEEASRSLRFVASRDWRVSAGLVDIAHAGISSDADMRVVIKGGRARRVEMHMPEKFLEDNVKGQDGVQKWIQKAATAAWYSYWYSFFRIHKQKKTPHTEVPKIWVCTGVHLISNAKVQSDSSSSSGQSAGATLDAGLIAGGIPTGQSIANVDVKHTQSQQANTDFSVKDYRVWAAKWFALDIDYLRPEEKNKISDEKYVIKLGEVEDLGSGGIREDSSLITSTVDDDGRRIALVKGLEQYDDTKSLEQHDHSDVNETTYSEALNGIDHGLFKKYRLYVDCLD